MMKTDYKQIRENEEINLLIEKGNEILYELGYTEHSRKHAAKVAEMAGKILKELGYGKHKIDLAKTAGYMHDIGNSINRRDHAHSGAILAYQLLKERNMSLTEAITVASAIGNHDESTGTAVDAVSAVAVVSPVVAGVVASLVAGVEEQPASRPNVKAPVNTFFSVFMVLLSLDLISREYFSISQNKMCVICEFW